MSEQLGRQRHVDPLGREPLLELGAGELGLPCGERRLDGLAHRVERHAGIAVAHLAQCELQRALAADVADAHLRERGERPRLGSGGECLLLEVVGIHGGDLIQRFLLLSRAREQTAHAPARAQRRRRLLLARRRPGYEPGLRKGEDARGRHLLRYYRR
jgi:hypothetical protein